MTKEDMRGNETKTPFRIYESPALPLSYPGTTKTKRKISGLPSNINGFVTLAKELVRALGVSGIRVYELHDEHGVHIHWLVDRYLPVQIVRRIAERHGFGRVHAKRCGKWVGDYLAKYLSKEVRAACLKGKRLWAGFGKATWCRVKDINVRSWLGQEYWRLRGDGVEVTRGQSYRILQHALRNYARRVDRADGVEVWLPEGQLGNSC